MPAKRSRSGGIASDREGPPAAVAVMSYDTLLAELPKESVAGALLAALGFHKPGKDAWGDDVCQCRDKGGSRLLWPCPEVRAVVAALSGEAVRP